MNRIALATLALALAIFVATFPRPAVLTAAGHNPELDWSFTLGSQSGDCRPVTFQLRNAHTGANEPSPHNFSYVEIELYNLGGDGNTIVPGTWKYVDGEFAIRNVPGVELSTDGLVLYGTETSTAYGKLSPGGTLNFRICDLEGDSGRTIGLEWEYRAGALSGDAPIAYTPPIDKAALVSFSD